MKHVGLGLLAGVVGYVIIAFVSYFLILKFSSNGFDRKMEAGMTSVFFFGPAGGILAFIAGYIWSKNQFP